MNINPKCAWEVSLLAMFVPASLAQSSVRVDRGRDDRIVLPSWDVRVVDSARALNRSDRDFMKKAVRRIRRSEFPTRITLLALMV